MELSKALRIVNYYWADGNTGQSIACKNLLTAYEEDRNKKAALGEVVRLASVYWTIPNKEQEEALASLKKELASL